MKNKSMSMNKQGKNSVKEVSSSKGPFPLGAILGISIVVLFIRILINYATSYEIDIGVYKSWGNYLYTNDFSGFYESGTHCIYGPGYLYLLWLIRSIADLFSLSDASYEYLIKFGSVIFDLLGAFIIYLLSKKYNKEKLGFVLAVFYALNPAVFFDSSVWGQFDTIQATLLLLVVYLFNTKKPFWAVLVFSVAVLTKPQSIILAPIVLLLFFRPFPWKKLFQKELDSAAFFKDFSWKTGMAFLTGIGTYFIMVLPFFSADPASKGNPLKWMVDFFTYIPNIILSGSQDYPYASANAFNLWTLLGGQAVTDTNPFAGWTYVGWSNVFLIAIVLLSFALLLVRRNSVLSLYYSCFFLYFGTFMFWSKMHERYLVPSLVFATVCILWDKKMWVPTVLLTLFSFLNQWYLYDMSFRKEYWVPNDSSFATIIAWMTLLVMVYSLGYLIWLALFKKTGSAKTSKKTST